MRYYAYEIHKEAGYYFNAQTEGTRLCSSSSRNGLLKQYEKIRERRALEGNPVKRVALMHTGHTRGQHMTWSSINYDPEGYGDFVDSSSFSMQEIIDFCRERNIPIGYVLDGDPADDGDHKAEWKRCCKDMAIDDAMDYSTWWSTSGSSRWHYLRFASDKTPEEFLLAIDEKDSTYKHHVDFDRFYRQGQHVDWLDDRSHGYNVFHYGANPIRIEIHIARYGYDIRSIWGAASAEEHRMNRLASAIVGMASPDEVDPSLLKDPARKEMLRQFTTGLCGMNMIDVSEHPMCEQLNLLEE